MKKEKSLNGKVTRRGFLKSLAVAGAFAGALGSSLGSPVARGINHLVIPKTLKMDEEIKGRIISPGYVEGEAIVTREPINFCIGFAVISVLGIGKDMAESVLPELDLPRLPGPIFDSKHELYLKNINGKILVFPYSVGSTTGGGFLAMTIDSGLGPAAMLVEYADTMIVGGAAVADVWLDKRIPILEFDAGTNIFEKIRTGDKVTVDGEKGIVRISRGVI